MRWRRSDVNDGVSRVFVIAFVVFELSPYGTDRRTVKTRSAAYYVLTVSVLPDVYLFDRLVADLSIRVKSVL